MSEIRADASADPSSVPRPTTTRPTNARSTAASPAPERFGRRPAAEDFHLQEPPRLPPPWQSDRVLRSYLERVLPAEVLRDIEPELEVLGELAGGELARLQAAERGAEPRLTRWDAWGERVDAIELTPLWRRAEEVAARSGLVAIPYERRHGRWSRLHQMALVHLFGPSTDIYNCPLAMTDGAAKVLSTAGNRPLAERAVPRLTSRDPERFWTSGQWMTETAGGSDVSGTGTVAVSDGGSTEGPWRLWGRKWFTSAATSQMALTLARPEGVDDGTDGGSRALALFYVETRGPDGRFDRLRIERLKDKLGTRKLPTAELFLEGVPAVPVAGLDGGVRAIAPMLNVTRTWNALSAVGLMTRGLALARDYARRRRAFGAPLAELPLHRDTLAGLQAEAEGAFHLAFRVVELLGIEEEGSLGSGEGDRGAADRSTTDRGAAELLRILTPIAKLTTARQAVAVTSGVVEAFGGAGYVEDTGVPALLRDAQVLPIWEGTTDMLSLDVLRSLGRGGEGLELLGEEIEARLAGADAADLAPVAGAVRAAFAAAGRWLEGAAGGDDGGSGALQAGARRFALTLGRCLEAALLVAQARWSLAERDDPRPRAAARRLAAEGLDRLAAVEAEDSRLLVEL